MGCCCGFDISGSTLSFNPTSLIMVKGNETNRYTGCVTMSVYSNRLAYDGCYFCNFCCLFGGFRGVIAFTNIHTLESNGNDIAIITKDGWKIDIVGLSREEHGTIKNTFSENASFLP